MVTQVLARKELDYGRMDERDLKQLSEEVNILQNLEPNENIVRYYERYVDRSKFRLHIIMEYCHNGDLAAQIQRCRRKKQVAPNFCEPHTLLREEVVWSYLAQIALALSDCHAEADAEGRPKQVILHRDIKPENVFLDKDNIIKLGDFGLSKAMASAAFTSTYVGTPYYMSPELINSQAYDQKSDIWALGCLIFELCAWHPPFHDARTQAELTKLIREGRIPGLPSVYSDSLRRVVTSMLRQDPNQRPSIAQLKQLEQVKMQIDVLKLAKMHGDLKLKQQHIELREAAMAERERLVSIRERDLDIERNELHSERLRLVQAFSNLSAYQSSSSSGASTSGTSTAPSSRDNSPLMDQKENIGLAPYIVTSTNETNPLESISKTIARVASRPSLVPRRPLEERRSMTGLNSLAKRMSCQSLTAMVVDGETPIKGNLMTPGTEARRRIATSKSMHNLKTSSSSRQESPTSRAHPPSSLAGSKQAHAYLPQPQSAGPTMSTFPAGFPARPASSSALENPSLGSRRSDSTASVATLVASPSKRPGPGSRTATAPQLSHATSTASISSLASLPTINPPRYNYDDEDSLPSPFIKKKASIGPLRALAAGQAAAISGANIHRAMSNSSIANAAVAPAPGVPSRAGRPHTTRQSLANRLAMHRQQKVDEQGRRLTPT
ncbi:MAG: G2-specific serine/threonine protein kinase [Cyphobasidiales sp. Tagirdzhanova-0007]|nr:MAG: G2-specific serine/threonine protein kinase [Cyphobasidiales sp. Tagirdzhanova-0007]